jgi:hypothetical protein
VDEWLNENRYPLHSVLREIQETDCGDLAALTPLVAELVNLSFKVGGNDKVAKAVIRWGNRPASLWLAEDLWCCASG